MQHRIKVSLIIELEGDEYEYLFKLLKQIPVAGLTASESELLRKLLDAISI